ncbi:hypothetical protein Bhyg_16672, partial [Pseudolycoriella hygida]
MSAKRRKVAVPKKINSKRKTEEIKVATPILSDSDDVSTHSEQEEHSSDVPVVDELKRKKPKLSKTFEQCRDPLQNYSVEYKKSHDNVLMNTINNNLTQISDEILKRMELMSDNIDKLMVSIKTMSETQLWLEKQVLALRKYLIRTDPLVQIDMKHKFPIDDEEVFKQFVQDLNDETYFELMLGRCRQEGGSSANKMVRNIWSFLFATCIQKIISWSGQHEKFKLGDTILFTLVQDATLLAYPTTTAAAVSETTKTFFQNDSLRRDATTYISSSYGCHTKGENNSFPLAFSIRTQSLKTFLEKN